MPRVNRRLLSGLKKCTITNTMEHVIEMSVAMAAPLMPQPRANMNSGASTTLMPAPKNMVSMARLG